MHSHQQLISKVFKCGMCQQCITQFYLLLTSLSTSEMSHLCLFHSCTMPQYIDRSSRCGLQSNERHFPSLITVTCTHCKKGCCSFHTGSLMLALCSNGTCCIALTQEALFTYFITNCINEAGNATASVCLSVCFHSISGTD